jgi:drug/metabolite transporter (DMT)-like permease
VHNASPALATSYAYVNPVVAVVLGVLLGGEGFASDSLTAIGLVLAGVALIVIFNPRRSH